MVVLTDILEKVEKGEDKFKTITVNKPLNIDTDAGNLLAFDPNVLDKKQIHENKNDYLLNLTRDNVQLLFNKIWELETEQVDETIVAKLPPSTYLLPRCKPVPRPKALTKWQQFAKDKGIDKKKKAKLTWDEQLKKWVPRYGFKKTQAETEKNWVIEVPANANPMEDQFAKKAVAKSERIAKNELQRLRNIAKTKNVKVPRFGLLNPDKSSAKDLQAAVTVAKSSTASIGKFQEKLPHEKEARGVASIVPGASSRKRKLPPAFGEQERQFNLSIVDNVLNKRPKLDINKAVSSHLHLNRKPMVNGNDEDAEPKQKRGKGAGKLKRSGKSKKPAKSRKNIGGGKGERKGKGGKGGGRKRR